ncbi:BlaI/MecI/CopY family transcriptional regulator [Hydrogenophaga sp. D2P1]|uniref:BlaI/MecI/CopY family transcriptional regulator n=1 Tax=Hydrogenophaga aromaticivorans TaxID=2610898 RepID=A0A7Y8GYK0_9BURK|nr:hypothetical protein [Hydrogenophaga aromaticivorans]NWF47256.1 BlaI/MecI/CopY family transcriptional regulator [Hydrogenophaga aromaticivorans]
MIDELRKSRAPDTNANGCWKGSNGHIHVEVKKTNSVRDVRGALLTLAFIIGQEPSKNQAVCVVVETRLSSGRLKEELVRFRQVIHPAIADRIHFLVGKGNPQEHIVNAFSGSMENAPAGFYDWLEELVAKERQDVYAHQLPPRQIVVAALAQLRLWNASPVTVKYLQETCRVSYPTVAAVLKELADLGWLEDSGERGVRLRYLTSGEWMELAREHARQRKVHLFTDPTGQNTPEQMVKRLASLREADKLPQTVRIGGVIGAAKHFPELDITAPPRLDLCVDRDPSRIASILDAGLLRKAKPDQRVALAIHVTSFPLDVSRWESKSQGHWASELECLADIMEMGYTREASEMAHHIALTNKETSTQHE